jgi:hypothetical protein
LEKEMKLSISLSTESKRCSCNWEAGKLRETTEHDAPHAENSLSLSLSVCSITQARIKILIGREDYSSFLQLGCEEETNLGIYPDLAENPSWLLSRAFSVRRNFSFKYSRRGSLGACRSTAARFLPPEKSARPVSSRLLQQQPKSGISVLDKKLFPSDQEDPQEFFESTERAQIMRYNIYAILDVMQLHLGGVFSSLPSGSPKKKLVK